MCDYKKKKERREERKKENLQNFVRVYENNKRNAFNKQNHLLKN